MSGQAPIIALCTNTLPLSTTSMISRIYVARSGLDTIYLKAYDRHLIEAIITARIIYFVAIDPFSKVAILLALTQNQDQDHRQASPAQAGDKNL